jgi:peptidoglycan-associated lipoprotein
MIRCTVKSIYKTLLINLPAKFTCEIHETFHNLPFNKNEENKMLLQNGRLKIVGLMAALLLVAACETTPDAMSGSSNSSGGKTGIGSGTGVGIDGGALKNPNAKPGSVEDFVDNVGDRVWFGFDSAEVSDEGRAILDKQAAWLKEYGSTNIAVEGHCDERGTREYNLALGQKRASSVKRYLIAAGVPANRVDTVSYGKERPEATGSSDEAWAQNRRGVSVIR